MCFTFKLVTPVVNNAGVAPYPEVPFITEPELGSIHQYLFLSVVHYCRVPFLTEFWEISYTSYQFDEFLKRKFWRHQSFFVELLIDLLLFWTFGDVCPGFQSQGGFLCLYAASPACNQFHSSPSEVTLADLLGASMAAELFQSAYFYIYTNIGGTRV